MENFSHFNIKKNFISLLGGQTISFIINFFSILLAARFLGVEIFGDFANLLAAVTILSKFVDFGMGPILFRELSKGKNENVFSNAISLKLILSLLLLIGMNIFFQISSLPPLEIMLANILFITIFISSRMANFREILATPFKANMNMQVPMILNVLDAALLLIGVMLIPIFDLGIVYFTIVYVLANLPGFILIIISLKKRFGYHIKFAFQNSKWLLKESVPLAGFVLLMVFFQQLDIILLKYLRGSFDAGIYAAAARLTLPLNIIPTTFVTLIFPYLVKAKDQNKEKQLIIKLVFKVLFFISTIIAVISSFKISEFVKLIFGEEYSAAAMPALLLFWSQIFLFFNFFSLDLLTVYQKQKWNFLYASLVFIINLGIDIILIPSYSFNGVGIAKLIAAIIGMIFLYIIVNKIGITTFNFNRPNILWWLICVLIMSYVFSLLPLVIYVLFSIVIIFILTYYIKFFNTEELILIFKFINKEKWLPKLIRN